jgi:hypothetical protein
MFASLGSKDFNQRLVLFSWHNGADGGALSASVLT